MAMNSYQIKADEKKAANIMGTDETFTLEQKTDDLDQSYGFIQGLSGARKKERAASTV